MLTFSGSNGPPTSLTAPHSHGCSKSILLQRLEGKKINIHLMHCFLFVSELKQSWSLLSVIGFFGFKEPVNQLEFTRLNPKIKDGFTCSLLLPQCLNSYLMHYFKKNIVRRKTSLHRQVRPWLLSNIIEDCCNALGKTLSFIERIAHHLYT